MEELQQILDSEVMALCGVNRTTVARWRAGAPIPTSSRKLILLANTGNLSALLGPTWAGWRVSTREGLLYHPQWRTGFNGDALASMWHGCQLRRELENRIERLQEDVARITAERDTLEQRAAFYRRQVTLEARLGLALAGICGDNPAAQSHEEPR